MKRPQAAKPCKGCPFRTDALPGWLGDNTPEAMALALSYGDRGEPEELPCHNTIDYADPDWRAKWLDGETGKRCVGSLVMLRRHCKRPRDPDYAAARDRVDEKAKQGTFANLREFIAYHNAAAIKSWER